MELLLKNFMIEKMVYILCIFFFFFKAETGTKFKLGQGSKSGNV